MAYGRATIRDRTRAGQNRRASKPSDETFGLLLKLQEHFVLWALGVTTELLTNWIQQKQEAANRTAQGNCGAQASCSQAAST